MRHHGNTTSATTRQTQQRKTRHTRTFPTQDLYTIIQTVTNANGTSSTTKQVAVGVTPTPTPTPTLTPTPTPTHRPQRQRQHHAYSDANSNADSTAYSTPTPTPSLYRHGRIQCHSAKRTATAHVTVTDNSTGATSWQYNFGDNTPNATTKNPAHTYPNPRIYTDHTNGEQRKRNLIDHKTSRSRPNANADTHADHQHQRQLRPQRLHPRQDRLTKQDSTLFHKRTATAHGKVTDNSTGATSWQYNFGDNTPNATTKNPAHTYPNASIYTSYTNSETTQRVRIHDKTSRSRHNANTDPYANTHACTAIPLQDSMLLRKSGQPPLTV